MHTQDKIRYLKKRFSSVCMVGCSNQRIIWRKNNADFRYQITDYKHKTKHDKRERNFACKFSVSFFFKKQTKIPNKNSLDEKKIMKGNLVECSRSFQFVQKISQFSVKKKSIFQFPNKPDFFEICKYFVKKKKKTSEFPKCIYCLYLPINKTKHVSINNCSCS